MEITAKELQEKINNGEKVIVDFWASFCGPCKLLKPIFEKVSSENTTGVQMYTMDVENNREFAVSLGIRSVPTVKLFKDGEEVMNKVGLMNEGEINNLIKLING
jgi:thioredoxin 1